ncbi:MAG: hypothetical protein R3C25_11830 [Hyphomonadaceae bacterium]
MTDFDALLKRSFAEAHEPADDGFAASVSHGVARREAMAKVLSGVQIVFTILAAATLAYAGWLIAMALGAERLLTFAGDGVGSARAALSTAPSTGEVATGFLRSLSAGMSQILLISAALAGGAVAYRASQD